LLVAGAKVERPEIVKKYLEALEAPVAPPSLVNLLFLTQSHVATFSFSSVGVRLQNDLSLDLSCIFERIVRDRRGGYCFEQNSLMFEVLQELGYDVEIKLARVIYGRDYLPGLTHRVTIVTLDDAEYVVDVGFGPNGPSVPVPLRGGASEDGNWTHRVVEHRPGEFHMQQRTKDGGLSLYRFDLAPYGSGDCELGHFYSHRHPEAVFVNNLVASRILDGEIRSLRNKSYFIIRPDSEDRIDIESATQLHDLLTHEVGVIVTAPEAERLFAELPEPT
jgi:N-hydroxyarylamine O-acetyltransferase